MSDRDYENGDYWHRACRDCQHEFSGPKREFLCAICRPVRDSKQPAPLAATHSEDGRDAVQVVAFLMKPDFCEPYVSLHRDSQTSALCEPLMTVAQHSRIVAAKDAEIVRLRESMMFACESLAIITSSDGSGHADISVAALRLAGIQPVDREKLVDGWKANRAWSAQPARQVGGEGSAAQKSFWAGFEAASMSKSSNIREAWNQYKATDEFARLNRCAIPAGLLERVCAIAECEGQPEGDELRALLGRGD